VKFSKRDIQGQLKALGVAEGDVIFVSSDLMKVGYFNVNRVQTIRDWIDIFAQLLGPSGTIILPTYSDVALRFGRAPIPIFTQDSQSTSGSLANAYITFVSDAIRSSHPIYSCIAVGPLAIELEKHTVQSGAYDPYGLVIEHSGKNLMLGTIDEINCPMPFHFAQQTLGHTRTHPLKGVFKTSYVNKTGEVMDHIMREIGGCTRGVHNIWGRHLAQKAVVFGQVGRSLSGLVDAAKSFAICVDVLRNQPGLIRCDNNLCLSCYGRYRYNGANVLTFYPRKTYHMISNFLKLRIG
jgi:aminoglycoside N3'-acetyltransferase